MKKFFFAFNSDDLSVFKDFRDETSTIVGFSDLNTYDFFNLSSVAIDHSIVSRVTHDLFESNCLLARMPFDCFKNNFYECTILPLAKIITFIEKYIDAKFDEVYFSNRLHFNVCSGPSYYMGEHESHRIFFYDRACSFQSYIELFLKSRSIKVRYFKSRISYNFIKNFVRDIVVLTALFTGLLKDSFKKNRSKQISTLKNAKGALVLVRTLAQLEFVSELVLSSKNNVTILVLSSSTSGSNLSMLCKNRFRNASNVDVYIANGNFRDVIKFLIKSLITYSKFYFIRTPKKCSIGLESFSFNRAFCEMSIMTLSTSLYSKALGDFLENHSDLYNILFTCEQKSPQAYIDSSRAHEYKLNCVQLMTCDQADDYIPQPVPSDLFIVDTKKTEKLFRASWRAIVDVNKIKFLGNIKSLKIRRVTLDSKSIVYDYCYFCHLTEIEQNIAIINILIDYCSSNGKTFCIKLHPRDDKRWLVRVDVPNEFIINNESFKQEDLFSTFDIAISNPSAVVMDLLGCSKKFIFINSMLTYQSLPNVYVDEIYPGYLKNLSDLSVLLNRGIDDDDIKSLRIRILGNDNAYISLDKIQNYLIQN